MNLPKWGDRYHLVLRLMAAPYPPLPLGFRQGWLLAFSVSTSLVVLAALPPFLPEGARSILMELFSGVCHQLDSRSPHVYGEAFAVCHRCFGSYMGLPVAVLFFGFVRGAWPFTPKTAPAFLFLATLPALVDWGGEIVGLWHNTPVSRILTGIVMGVGAGYFLVAAIVDWFMDRSKQKGTTRTSKT